VAPPQLKAVGALANLSAGLESELVDALLLLADRVRVVLRWPPRCATYLQARQPYIPDYREYCWTYQYIGSGHVEKANNLQVARRQKWTSSRRTLDDYFKAGAR